MPAKFDVLDQLLHGATTVVQWNREEMFRAPRADFTQCYKREALRYAFVVMGLGVIPPDAEIVVRAAKKESFAADPRIPHSVVDVQVDSHDLAIAFQGTLHTRRSRLLARLLSVFADSAEDGAREVAERQLHSGLA